MDLDNVWKRSLAHLEGTVSPHDAACWISAIRPKRLSANSLFADVPSAAHLEQIRSRFAAPLRRALAEELGAETDLVLSVNAEHARGPRPTPSAERPFSARYTFDTFVTGASNEIAYRSARRAADQPGISFNPLFLHGGVGLGKTHLATAVANALWKGGAAPRIAFFSAEAFTNDLVRAFRTDSVDAFRARLRQLHALIVDDVQFLAGKERMQEEFFHTFNALSLHGRQIVLASDKPPRDIPNLEERLRNRFESGLITDIQKPDLPLRLAILARKAATLLFPLPSDVAQLIASRIVSSVRELEGALHRLIAACQTSRRSPDLAFAADVLRPILRTPAPRTLGEVRRIVAERFRLTEEELICRRRARRFSFPRQIAMYLARKGTNATYAEIAAGFGGRDHSTVMAAVKGLEQRRSVEPDVAEILERLELKLQSG